MRGRPRRTCAGTWDWGPGRGPPARRTHLGVDLLEGRIILIHLEVDLCGGDGERPLGHHHGGDELCRRAEDHGACKARAAASGWRSPAGPSTVALPSAEPEPGEPLVNPVCKRRVHPPAARGQRFELRGRGTRELVCSGVAR